MFVRVYGLLRERVIATQEGRHALMPAARAACCLPSATNGPRSTTVKRLLDFWPSLSTLTHSVPHRTHNKDQSRQCRRKHVANVRHRHLLTTASLQLSSQRRPRPMARVKRKPSQSPTKTAELLRNPNSSSLPRRNSRKLRLRRPASVKFRWTRVVL